MAVGASTWASGQPCVEWDHRHLDGEADEEHHPHHFHEHQTEDRLAQTEEVHPHELRDGERPGNHRAISQVERLAMRGDVELTCVVDGDERQQHEDGARKRVEEELDGRVLLARTTPDADEEVHRQQHHFPEDVEQEHVERDEHAHHACHQKAEHRPVALELLLDAERC